MTSFSEALHEELRTTGVVVTVVCPGATRTEFGDVAGATADDLPAFLWQDADEVVAEALEAAAKARAVRVTGLPNRVTASLASVLPRSLNRRMAALVAGRL